MLPPEVERFFAEERKKQQLIAVTQKNLIQTANTLNNILDKANQRGATLEQREEQAEELLDSSEEFHVATLPAWKRYVYTIKWPWWCVCFCKKKKKRQDL